MMTTIRVEGMVCRNCATTITDALLELSGVQDVEVDLDMETVSVQAAPEVTVDDITNAVTDLGYVVS